MKLKNVEMIPGVVVSNADPELKGRVKAAVPGIFDTTTMSMESLPWIYPLTMSGHQRFSKPENGDKIWLINNTENYHEFWYIFLPEFHTATNTRKEQYDGPEVIFSRTSGDNKPDMYYNAHEGIVSNCSGNQLQLEPSGDAHLTGSGNTRGIWVKGSTVYTGDGGDDSQPAVFGDNLFNLLSDLANKLEAAGSAAGGFWATTGLANPLMECSQAISKVIDTIRVNYTYVD